MKSAGSKTFKYLIVLLLIICVTGENAWHTHVPLSTNILDFVLGSLSLFLLYSSAKKGQNYLDDGSKKIITYYFVWFGFTCLRGPFMAVDYFCYRNLFFSIPITFFPLFFYVFSTPEQLAVFLRKWVVYSLPFFIILAFDLSHSAYGFYLAPISLFLVFLWDLKPRWIIVLLIITIFASIADLAARSNVIKFLAPFLLSLAFLFKSLIGERLLKFAGVVFVFFPYILIPLAAFGGFNLLQDSGFSYELSSSNNNKDENLFDDTRTFIYYEVIESAIDNDYWLWGRTPARGNDTHTFLFEEFNDDHHRPVQERFANEIGAANAFTHFGIIGLFIILLLYYRAAYLALYKSRSYYMKLIGVFICFRSFFFFLEDYYSFRVQTFVLVFMLGMGLSARFREMTNNDFKLWINNILK